MTFVIRVELVYDCSSLIVAYHSVCLECTCHIPSYRSCLALGLVSIGRLHVVSVFWYSVWYVPVWVLTCLLVVVYVSRYFPFYPHKSIVSQVLLATLSYLSHCRKRPSMPSWSHCEFTNRTCSVNAVVVEGLSIPPIPGLFVTVIFYLYPSIAVFCGPSDCISVRYALHF